MPVKVAALYKKYTIELEAEGEMAQLTSLIYQLQNSPQLLKVEKMQMSAKSGSSGILKSRLVISKIKVL